MRANPWDKIAKWYDQRVGDEGDINQRTVINPAILKLLGEIKGKKILDAGCGQGYLSRIISKMGADVIGLDYSQKLIAYAQSKCRTVEYIHADLLELDKLFKQEIFDIVILNMVIHNISDLAALCERISRVLKNNGSLIITTLHPCFIIPGFSHWEKDSHLVTTGYLQLPSPLFRKLDKASPAKIPFYHRTIASYFEELTKNNLVLNNFLEFAKSEESLKKGENPNIKRKFPSFILIYCQKRTDS